MNILEKMEKVIFSVLTLLLTMNIAFAQIEIMSSEQAKQQLSSSLVVNSMNKDDIISKRMRHVSDKDLENGVELQFFGKMDVDPVGIRVLLVKNKLRAYYPKEACGVLCSDSVNNTLSIEDMEPGYYTITGRLLFKEQLERHIHDYIDNCKMPSTSRIVYYNSGGVSQEPVADSTIIKAWLKNFVQTAVKKDSYIMKNSKNNILLIFTDQKGRCFYVPTDAAYFSHFTPTNIANYVMYACPYVEKVSKLLKGQECYIDIDKEFFLDEITGATVTSPAKNKTYKCEKVIVVDDKIIGVFSDGTDSYSLKIGGIATYFFDSTGSDAYKEAEKSSRWQGYSFYLGEFDRAYYLNSYGRIGDTWNNEYAALCDAYINVGNDHVSNVCPIALKKKTEELVASLRNNYMAVLKEAKAREENRRLQEERENVSKYGNEFADDIKNHKVAINMTKEMCLKAWGYPSDRYSARNSLGVVEVWGYYNAILYFSNDRLVQIDKW